VFLHLFNNIHLLNISHLGEEGFTDEGDWDEKCYFACYYY